MAGSTLDSLREIQDRMSRLKRKTFTSTSSRNLTHGEVIQARDQIIKSFIDIQGALAAIIRDMKHETDITVIHAAVSEFVAAATEINNFVKLLE